MPDATAVDDDSLAARALAEGDEEDYSHWLAARAFVEDDEHERRSSRHALPSLVVS